MRYANSFSKPRNYKAQKKMYMKEIYYVKTKEWQNQRRKNHL